MYVSYTISISRIQNELRIATGCLVQRTFHYKSFWVAYIKKKKYQVYLEKYFGVIPVESQLVEADKLILKY